MRRSSLIVLLVELGLIVTSWIVALRLPAAGFQWSDVAWFVIGLTVLKLSDVWLPRGDAVGMSAALALGALLLFDARVVLVMLLVAELLALLPAGRNRVWRAAAGALAAEAIASVVCSSVLLALGLHPSVIPLATALQQLHAVQYILILAVGLLFAALEFGLFQLGTAVQRRQRPWPALLGSLSLGGWLIAAQASAGALAALMFRTMGAWGLVVSVVIVLVMRQSFELLLEIREAYNSTISVLVKAMEAQTPGRQGVAEANAHLCTLLGRQVGLHGRDLERLRYAALLAGIGAGEGVADAGSLADDGRIGPSQVVSEVEFLQDVVPVLELCESVIPPHNARHTDLVSAYIVLAVGRATGTIPDCSISTIRERLNRRLVSQIDCALEDLTKAMESRLPMERGDSTAW